MAATKPLLGIDPGESFAVSSEVLNHAQRVSERGADMQAAWEVQFAQWAQAQPVHAALLHRLRNRELPDLDPLLPAFEPGTAIATRAAFGKVLNAFAAELPELWGGSADLAESNNTALHGSASFLPESSSMANAHPAGRVIHFGVREHAMGSILNGIALDRLSRPFGGTFLVFSDYMRGSVRLAALMGVPTTFVWTHDSIGLGEDGPTHQPVEHLWSLRAIPRFHVVRPADATETAGAYAEILRREHPAGLVLSRQNLPVLASSDAKAVVRGGYIIKPESHPLSAVIIATGSEVAVSVSAAEALEADGFGVRVVSMPCLEWFDAQPQSYRDSVIPPSCVARVAVEAGSSIGWWKYVGSLGSIVAVDDFGASAAAEQLFAQRGFTTENIATVTSTTIARAQSETRA